MGGGFSVAWLSSVMGWGCGGQRGCECLGHGELFGQKGGRGGGGANTFTYVAEDLPWSSVEARVSGGSGVGGGVSDGYGRVLGSSYREKEK